MPTNQPGPCGPLVPTSAFRPGARVRSLASPVLAVVVMAARIGALTDLSIAPSEPPSTLVGAPEMTAGATEL
ncbi:Uncharacterised protein [Mycobacteroides abscessus subsp. abscessus]|nr:Uncharacterised protein [Mycobacteroides abscessus subsp. abscessus]